MWVGFLVAGTTRLLLHLASPEELADAVGVPSVVVFQASDPLRWARVHGECRHGPAIDGEVGELTRPSENPEYLYARYDRVFSDEDLRKAEKVTRAGFTLDNLELMDFLCERGAAHAAEVVRLEHFDDE